MIIDNYLVYYLNTKLGPKNYLVKMSFVIL